MSASLTLSWPKILEPYRSFIISWLLALGLGFVLELYPLLKIFYQALEAEQALLLAIAEQENKGIELKQRLPALREMASKIPAKNWLKQINEEAIRHQAYLRTWESQKSKEGKEGGGLATVDLKLELLAAWQQQMTFLEALQTSATPLYLQRFYLWMTEEGVLGRYYFKVYPEARFSPGRPLARSLKRDPFEASNTLADLSAVKTTEFPIQDLRYLGFYQREGRRQALILLPEGEVIELAIGEALGREGWIVKAISTTALSLRARDHQLHELRR